MSHQDPIELLARSRPEVTIRDPATLDHKELNVQWGMDDDLPTFVCRWPMQSADDTNRSVLGFYQSDYEGTFPVFLRYSSDPIPSRPECVSSWALDQVIDVGTTPDGPVSWSFFLHGASLHELALAGFRMPWSLAQCIHAAFRKPLVELHVLGIVHGAVTASNLRLVTVSEPYSEIPDPVRLCHYRGLAATRSQTENELRVLSEAICTLTTHPETQIRELLASEEEGALDVLADKLLEAGEQIDILVADRLLAGSPTTAQAVRALASEEIQEDVSPVELTALWKAVVGLAPLIDESA